MNYRLLFTALTLLISFSSVAASNILTEKTEKGIIQATILTDGLNHPWGLAFLPDSSILITERSGQLIRLDKEGKNRQSVDGLPLIKQYGQGGLLDVVIHPDFSNNNLIYISYAAQGKNGIGTEVARGKLEGAQLKNITVVFRLLPKTDNKQHFGSRLVFDNNGHLYITLGDRGNKPRAQRLDDHAGSVIRINVDGSIPDNNPFINDKTQKEPAKPEIFSFGHRNIQGAALHPQTGELWLHEHGPQGGDELNISRAGINYGWPVITYGVNYGTGTKIGEGTEKEDMAQPLYVWTPSIAPSGMTFYTGNHFKQWKDNILLGSLKFQLLVRLELDGEKIIHEERIFKNKFGRIRDVRQGPDGLLYLLTDAANGKLIRLQPAKP